MKKVYETAADMILSGIVFAALIAIILGAALFEKAGRRMKVESEDFSVMKDTLAVEAVCQRKTPSIRCAGKKVWELGEPVFVRQAFAAEDAEGNSLAVRVLDIINHEGTSVLECYQKETDVATFSQRGVYTFSLKAVDQERKSKVEQITILVDQR